MWELGYKESWMPKNWCFWTVVLEKTLESPLDCKEIKPVDPKGNQSWIFTGRTNEAETPILWPPDMKSWLNGNKPWCWETLKPGGEGDNRGWDGWMASPTRWIWAWASSREVWRPWGRKESDMTEQLNWTEGLRMCLCRFNTFPFISQRDFKILSLLEKESLLSRKNPGITRIQKLLHN